MKNTIIIFLCGLLLVSCKQSITDKDISKINGYWEIKKVELPDGTKKDYKVNETIDFFKVEENKGFRQKVMPQFDGTYKTNNISETIAISNENGTYFINYSTTYGKWKEEIIEIKDSVLIVKNKDKLEYNYKRFQPFSLK
ncbi:hypothetical protein OX283_004575 [Flavobacterium sp. SUN052]|uniref:hypothetical protein n=1 Tax=Flavobacterium sp. SUN052 TaxID=3002441 RepID=UPI00237ED87C|nr:hypothetical protein [Flavobacterium sp. SUN052]MEC4003920.1 hypothetical protein [Flavobacterium sp. SUN052]